MAAPDPRPQYLLPWIAVCTAVLGLGLQSLAPQHGRRGPAGSRADVERQPEPLTAPLPQLLAPTGSSILVLDPDVRGTDALAETQLDPSRPALHALGETPASGLAENDAGTLAGRKAEDTSRIGERELPRETIAPPTGGLQRPSWQSPDANAEQASLAPLLAAPGAALRLRWNGSAPAAEPEALGQTAELVILRVSDETFQAFLLLEDPLAEVAQEKSGEDPAASAPPQAEYVEEPVEVESSERPRAARWERWFASRVPPSRAVQAPKSRAELRTLLAQTIGEAKTQYLAAASRELDAREAAAMLGQVRRWVLEQRGG